MIGYRGAIYRPKDKEVEILTWSETGERISTFVHYEPYFYVENSFGEEKTVYGTRCTKKSFASNFAKNEWLQKTGIKRIFDSYPATQHVLLNTYKNHNDTPEFSKFPLKICYLDIEAVGAGEFAKPENPFHPINVITIYNSLEKCYYSWGLEEYTPKEENVKYQYFRTENALLEAFLCHMEDHRYDLLSGWAIETYDIPYIINRIKRQLGENESNRLSPCGYIYTQNKKDKFGNFIEVYKISGLSIIDYLEAYQKFSPNKRESYKLDYIGEVELGQKKTDYGNRSLYQLMCDDWELFVDYNIQDVKLLTLLENTLKYLELTRMIAYIGCTLFESALQTVSVVTGAMGIIANKRNEKLGTFINDSSHDFEGGFVAEPNVGHHKDIITFDANSLYPNVMITCNMSNETKFGKVISNNNDKVIIRHVNGKDLEVDKKHFFSYLKREKLALSRANVLFTQKRMGILAELADGLYKKRVETRNEAKKIRKEYNELLKIISDYEKLHPELKKHNP